jgi:L-threonylcarbamoyladenylate synthase
VAAPSANRFGRVSPTRALDVLAEVGSSMDPERDLVVDGGACAIGVESTIVDCTAIPPRVLRLGAISQEQVDAALAVDAAGQGDARRRAGTPTPDGSPGAATAAVPDGVGAGAGRGHEVVGEGGATDVRAPGTLESHYAPLAAVVLVEAAHATAAELDALGAHRAAVSAGRSAARRPGQPGGDPFGLVTLDGSHPARIIGDRPSIGLVAPSEVATPSRWTRLVAPVSAEEYARGLYAALRRADELGLDVVVAVLPEADGGPLALAVRDRLSRAAHEGGT